MPRAGMLPDLTWPEEQRRGDLRARCELGEGGSCFQLQGEDMSEERLIAVAAEDDRGLEGEVGAHFGRCPYYVLVEADAQNVTGSRVVANPYFDMHRPGVMPRFIRDLGA